MLSKVEIGESAQFGTAIKEFRIGPDIKRALFDISPVIQRRITRVTAETVVEASHMLAIPVPHIRILTDAEEAEKRRELHIPEFTMYVNDYDYLFHNQPLGIVIPPSFLRTIAEMYRRGNVWYIAAWENDHRARTAHETYHCRNLLYYPEAVKKDYDTGKVNKVYDPEAHLRDKRELAADDFALWYISHRRATSPADEFGRKFVETERREKVAQRRAVRRSE